MFACICVCLLLWRQSNFVFRMWWRVWIVHRAPLMRRKSATSFHPLAIAIWSAVWPRLRLVTLCSNAVSSTFVPLTDFENWWGNLFQPVNELWASYRQREQCTSLPRIYMSYYQDATWRWKVRVGHFSLAERFVLQSREMMPACEPSDNFVCWARNVHFEELCFAWSERASALQLPNKCWILASAQFCCYKRVVLEQFPFQRQQRPATSQKASKKSAFRTKLDNQLFRRQPSRTQNQQVCRNDCERVACRNLQWS